MKGYPSRWFFLSTSDHPMWAHWWRRNVRILRWQENGIYYTCNGEAQWDVKV